MSSSLNDIFYTYSQSITLQKVGVITNGVSLVPHIKGTKRAH